MPSFTLYSKEGMLLNQDKVAFAIIAMELSDSSSLTTNHLSLSQYKHHMFNNKCILRASLILVNILERQYKHDKSRALDDISPDWTSA